MSLWNLTLAGFCVMATMSSAASATGPVLGPEVPGTAPDRLSVLVATQSARLNLSGLELNAKIDELRPEYSDAPLRAWTESISVAPDAAELVQTYWIAQWPAAGGSGVSIVQRFAFDGAQATYWESTGREAQVGVTAASLPSCNSEYFAFTAWYPVPHGGSGTAPADLRDMLASSGMDLAAFRQTVDGAECLVLRSTGEGPVVTTVWIDPARGYFPRLQRVEKNGSLVAQWHINEFTQLGDEAWIPSGGLYWCQPHQNGAAPFDGPTHRVLTIQPGAALESPTIVPMDVPADSTLNVIEGPLQ